MTLTQLKYAITVSEAGSMNQAAKELFISAEPVACHTGLRRGNRCGTVPA